MLKISTRQLNENCTTVLIIRIFPLQKEEEESSTPIWKVGRMLMDSLSKGKMRRTKIFGAPLEDLPLNCQGMPKIAHRLCCYLEQYGE